MEISYRCEKNHFTSFPFTSADIQYEMGIFLKRQYYRGIDHLNQLLTQEFSRQQSKINIHCFDSWWWRCCWTTAVPRLWWSTRGRTWGRFWTTCSRRLTVIAMWTGVCVRPTLNWTLVSYRIALFILCCGLCYTVLWLHLHSTRILCHHESWSHRAVCHQRMETDEMFPYSFRSVWKQAEECLWPIIRPSSITIVFNMSSIKKVSLCALQGNI